jgi:hypothetical protein
MSPKIVNEPHSSGPVIWGSAAASRSELAAESKDPYSTRIAPSPERHFNPGSRFSLSRRLGLVQSNPGVKRSLAKMSVAVVLLVVASASPFWAQSPQAPNKTTEELPAGTLQAKATTACLECHEARIIVQQRLSKAAWTKEVDKMTKWGAVVDPKDHDALIDYLSANFGTDQPAYDAPRTAPEKTTK